MACLIVRWVAEPGLARPVNHVFESRPASRNRVRRVHHQPRRLESGGSVGGNAGNMVDSFYEE